MTLPFVYRALTWPLPPLVRLYLRRRCRRGKEDRLRLGERRGIAGIARPPGPLIWIHSASVGEATAVLQLIERLLETRPELEVLATTGTIASAQLLAKRLPARARHQFVPVDLSGWVERFLDFWRPDMAIWVESELWPNLVLSTHARSIPMMLINARLSARSVRRWQRWPRLIQPVLGAFAQCLAQDDQQARRLRRLGAENVVAIGDLKAAGDPLPFDQAELRRLRREVGARPLWLAASTHQGEEESAAAVHATLAAKYPGLLTIIAPRHPIRGDAVATMLSRSGLRVARRSRGEPITDQIDIYLADTMGELGLLYRVAEIAFIGGSLVRHGGHNPFEAARLDCAILYGPDISNCAAMAAALAEAGAAQMVADAEELARMVSLLLSDLRLRAARRAAALRVAAEGEAVLAAVLMRLAPWLDRIAPRRGAPARGGLIAAGERAPHVVRA